MCKISINEKDDLEFIEIAERFLNRIVENLTPTELYLIKIDNWFDFKWRAFEGKHLGALGAWNEEELKIPPFIPDRVSEQSYFERLDGIYAKKQTSALHIYQSSSDNITGKRKLKAFSKTRMFCWFSGNTKNSLRGSIMLYQIDEKKQQTFYVSFLKKKSWQIYKTDKISRNEVLNLIS